MEASQAEKNVFGADVKLHPITKMPIEQGLGALSDDAQAQIHCQFIERSSGKHAADEMRRRLTDTDTIRTAEADMAEVVHEQHTETPHG
jgi:hypothetical protein